MVEVVFSESALNDLDSITNYISLDSLRYAQEFANRVFDRVEQLQSFPDSGRVVPEFNNRLLREIIIGKYRIVYRKFKAEKIIILRIVHGSKLLE